MYELRLVMQPPRAVSSELDAPAKAVPAVVMERIGQVQAMHASGQGAVADAQDQVVMGLHQAVGKATPLDCPRHPGEMSKELEPVGVISV
ncbi:MAG TPA: hypothetical protein VE985_05430 [Gaiellaceae bacterium]|nr:hypothetical protein [Gaiellaceae bacterium]